MRIKMRSIFFGLLLCGVLAYGTDCDGSFVLDSSHLTVQFNNQSRACFNWQISYFSSGFSAVSVQFESAPNGSNSNVPGAWTAFAGTILSGSNPATAITQATSTFSGSFPWVRVRLVSSTGTGTINGRMLGAQLTSATVFQNGFNSGSGFGNFHPPQDSAFSFINQGNATRTVLSDGLLLQIPTASATDNLSKLCTPIGISPPFTVTIAFAQYGSPNVGQFHTGLMMYQAAGAKIEEFPRIDSGNYTVFNFYNCTTTLFASCGAIQSNNFTINTPYFWERVVDTGVVRNWQTSLNGGSSGDDWALMSNYQSNGADYAANTPNQACFYIYNNDNNFLVQSKLVSFQVCPNTTGVC